MLTGLGYEECGESGHINSAPMAGFHGERGLCRAHPSEPDDQQLLMILKERGRRMVFPIWVGRYESDAVAAVELPWAPGVPRGPVEELLPAGNAEAVNGDCAMTRGILVGLGVSMPLWLGIGWLVTVLLEALPIR